jgi:hypothetical protein
MIFSENRFSLFGIMLLSALVHKNMRQSFHPASTAVARAATTV